MSQKCNVEITINNISNEMAKAVEKSLEPDNVNFPKGLSMKVEKIDNKLVFNFSNSGNTVSYTHLTLPTILLV